MDWGGSSGGSSSYPGHRGGYAPTGGNALMRPNNQSQQRSNGGEMVGGTFQIMNKYKKFNVSFKKKL